MIRIFLAFIALVISNCASKSTINSEVQQDQVIKRIDDLKERPSWLKESEVFKIENGQVLSLGVTTLPGDNRPEAGIRIAENNAKARIASTIEQRLEFIFQNAEEGTNLDSTQARFIGAEASKMVTSSLKPGKIYWEKVLTHTEDGQRKFILQIYAEVTMAEADLKKAISDASRKRNGDSKLSSDFSDKVNQHWNDFVRGPASETK